MTARLEEMSRHDKEQQIRINEQLGMLQVCLWRFYMSETDYGGFRLLM